MPGASRQASMGCAASTAEAARVAQGGALPKEEASARNARLSFFTEPSFKYPFKEVAVAGDGWAAAPIDSDGGATSPTTNSMARKAMADAMNNTRVVRETSLSSDKSSRKAHTTRRGSNRKISLK